MESESLSTETLLLNATQRSKDKPSASSSSLSTETLLLIARQRATADSTIVLDTSKLTLREPEPSMGKLTLQELELSTPSDVSLSDDYEEVQKATKHLQEISRLLSSQTPPSSDSEGDPDEDYEVERVEPISQSQRSVDLPSDGDRRALGNKLSQ